MTIEEKLNEYNSKHKVKFSMQMVRYVRKVHKGKSHKEMRKHLGLSRYAFQKLAELTGTTYAGHNAKMRKIVEKYAPHMTYKEMAEKFGYCESNWAHLARKMGIKCSEEKKKRTQERRRNAINEVKNRDGYWGKISDIMRKKWRMEYFRVRSGMPQQTNLYLRQVGKGAYSIIYKYIRDRGYIQDENDFKTLYYDDNTKRSNVEKKMAEKYKLKILPISENKGI